MIRFYHDAAHVILILHYQIILTGYCVTLRKLTHAIYRKFFGCKNEKFQWKNFDIFLIFAQNIDCGYTFREPPRRGGSNEYPQCMFWSKNKKNRYTLAANPIFSIKKVGYKGVSISRTRFPDDITK